jgi:PPOX class probable F420-dependent enzyme
MALTTFRRDGRAVTTPVWFVTRAGEVCVWTDAGSGKVKRLRRDPRCAVAPCTARGRLTGVAVEGRARFLSPDDGGQVQALLRAKYPIQKRALDIYTRLRRRGRPVSRSTSVHLGISVAD